MRPQMQARGLGAGGVRRIRSWRGGGVGQISPASGRHSRTVGPSVETGVLTGAVDRVGGRSSSPWASAGRAQPRLMTVTARATRNLNLLFRRCITDFLSPTTREGWGLERNWLLWIGRDFWSSVLQPSRSLAKEDAVQRNGYRTYELTLPSLFREDD